MVYFHFISYIHSKLHVASCGHATAYPELSSQVAEGIVCEIFTREKGAAKSLTIICDGYKWMLSIETVAQKCSGLEYSGELIETCTNPPMVWKRARSCEESLTYIALPCQRKTKLHPTKIFHGKFKPVNVPYHPEAKVECGISSSIPSSIFITSHLILSSHMQQIITWSRRHPMSRFSCMV